MVARNMTFDLLDHVIKVTFEQRIENNAIVLSPVKVPSIAPLTVSYIVYKLSSQLLVKILSNYNGDRSNGSTGNISGSDLDQTILKYIRFNF